MADTIPRRLRRAVSRVHLQTLALAGKVAGIDAVRPGLPPSPPPTPVPVPALDSADIPPSVAGLALVLACIHESSQRAATQAVDNALDRLQSLAQCTNSHTTTDNIAALDQMNATLLQLFQSVAFLDQKVALLANAAGTAALGPGTSVDIGGVDTSVVTVVENSNGDADAAMRRTMAALHGIREAAGSPPPPMVLRAAQRALATSAPNHQPMLRAQPSVSNFRRPSTASARSVTSSRSTDSAIGDVSVPRQTARDSACSVALDAEPLASDIPPTKAVAAAAAAAPPAVATNLPPPVPPKPDGPVARLIKRFELSKLSAAAPATATTVAAAPPKPVAPPKPQLQQHEQQQQQQEQQRLLTPVIRKPAFPSTTAEPILPTAYRTASPFSEAAFDSAYDSASSSSESPHFTRRSLPFAVPQMAPPSSPMSSLRSLSSHAHGSSSLLGSIVEEEVLEEEAVTRPTEEDESSGLDDHEDGTVTEEDDDMSRLASSSLCGLDYAHADDFCDDEEDDRFSVISDPLDELAASTSHVSSPLLAPLALFDMMLLEDLAHIDEDAFDINMPQPPSSPVVAASSDPSTTAALDESCELYPWQAHPLERSKQCCSMAAHVRARRLPVSPFSSKYVRVRTPPLSSPMSATNSKGGLSSASAKSPTKASRRVSAPLPSSSSKGGAGSRTTAPANATTNKPRRPASMSAAATTSTTTVPSKRSSTMAGAAPTLMHPTPTRALASRGFAPSPSTPTPTLAKRKSSDTGLRACYLSGAAASRPSTPAGRPQPQAQPASPSTTATTTASTAASTATTPTTRRPSVTSYAALRHMASVAISAAPPVYTPRPISTAPASSPSSRALPKVRTFRV
ncbi:hypothetical protein BC828DRAFT_371748 [Blastocladiella britannica]|nr:hypothetical protein BC828DRAFT_371748 [Blastocladiella britannica]